MLEINYLLCRLRLFNKMSFKMIDHQAFCEVAQHKSPLTSPLVSRMQRNPDSLVPNYYALILAVSVHVSITIIADGEYVWWKLSDFTIFVEFDLFRGINR